MPKMSYDGSRLGQRLLSPLLAFTMTFTLSLISPTSIAPVQAESTESPNQPAATVITVDTSEDLDPTSLNKTCTFAQGAIFFPASDGKCTLRRAINEAAARPQADRPIEIRFNLSNSDANKDLEVAGTWTLPITKAFPRLKTDSIVNKNGQVTIDGNSQPGGRTDGPKIIINTNDNSLEVESEKNIIRNLSFKGGGVIFLKEDGNLVEKIWMGLNDDGNSLFLEDSSFGTRPAGGGVFISSDGNTVQDNVISGALAKAVDIQSNKKNNIVQRNFIGTRADGTVPTVPTAAQCLRNFNYDPQNWYGGWGINISGSNNKVLDNRIAGLHTLQSANDTPPMAIEIFGANHTVEGNIIGVDSAGKKVGVCGQGIKVSGSGTQILDNVITGSRIGFEDIIPTAILASDTSPLFGQITVRGNYVEDGPGGIYEMGPGLPKSLQEFEPAKITNITGKNVSGTAGNGSPCAGCIIDFYSDDLDNIGEAFTYLGQEAADSNGNFTFAMTQTLPSGAGIRTSSTSASAGVIGSYGAGTTTKFSKLYYPLSSVEISGPLTGTAGITYTFTITVSQFGPESLDYSVKATDVTTLTASSKNHVVSISYNWQSAGSKSIEVNVTNDLSAVLDTHKITISGSSSGSSGKVYLPLVAR